MVVLVEDGFSVGSDENIRPPVVVIIADGDSHSERAAGYASFLGDVGKCSIPIVLVQRIADRA